MCRSASTFDIPAPNPCGTTDNICSLSTQQWPDRMSSIFSRFSYFCGRPGIGGCQRTFFSRLANNHTAVMKSNVSWDVGPVNRAYGNEIISRPYVSIDKWPRYRYILSTDGWSSACRFGQSLAMGSTTLKVNSDCKMWFEYILEPNREYVPVWNDGVFDIVDKLRSLQQNPQRAQRIARRGKDAACSLLTQERHIAYWEAVLPRYQRLVTYTVDATLMKNRSLVRVHADDIECQELNWHCSMKGRQGK
jgi:hypothetical protein